MQATDTVDFKLTCVVQTEPVNIIGKAKQKTLNGDTEYCTFVLR
ncbi:hypothetical protein IMCC1989_2576 [gamma proteobacterium IMCC1989]|nr:hypothetical protein IMCC1989_2576 [gamma proteobacterium IMCC1989]